MKDKYYVMINKGDFNGMEQLSVAFPTAGEAQRYLELSKATYKDSELAVVQRIYNPLGVKQENTEKITDNDLLKEAINIVSIYKPCAHSNTDLNLGDGTTWAKCEDCGETILQENIELYKSSAKKFRDAIDIINKEFHM